MCIEIGNIPEGVSTTVAGQKERKHSGWAALVVKAVAKKGSLLTHSSTEVPEQVILSSRYESNYSESESGQILSSNICI